MEVKIREAHLGDIEILDELQNKLGHYEKKFDPVIKQEGRIRYRNLKEYERLVNSKDALILLAEFKGKTIGCGFCEIEKNEASWSIYPKKAWIKQMWVEKKYREKNIGKKIMEKLIAWLHKKKIYDIRLRVYADNPSVKAYRKYGFKDYIYEMNYKK